MRRRGKPVEGNQGLAKWMMIIKSINLINFKDEKKKKDNKKTIDP